MLVPRLLPPSPPRSPSPRRPPPPPRCARPRSDGRHAAADFPAPPLGCHLFHFFVEREQLVVRGSMSASLIRLSAPRPASASAPQPPWATASAAPSAPSATASVAAAAAARLARPVSRAPIGGSAADRPRRRRTLGGGGCGGGGGSGPGAAAGVPAAGCGAGGAAGGGQAGLGCPASRSRRAAARMAACEGGVRGRHATGGRAAGGGRAHLLPHSSLEPFLLPELGDAAGGDRVLEQRPVLGGGAVELLGQPLVGDQPVLRLQHRELAEERIVGEVGRRERRARYGGDVLLARRPLELRHHALGDGGADGGVGGAAHRALERLRLAQLRDRRRPSAPPPPADACRFSDTASALSASTFWTESPRTRAAAPPAPRPAAAPRGTVPRVNGCFCAARRRELGVHFAARRHRAEDVAVVVGADSWSPRSEPPGVRPRRSRPLHPSPSAGAPNEGAIPRVVRPRPRRPSPAARAARAPARVRARRRPVPPVRRRSSSFSCPINELRRFLWRRGGFLASSR